MIGNRVLQPEQFGKDLLLPRCVKTLLRQLDETALVNDNMKLSHLQITSPMIDCHYDRHVFLFICRQALRSRPKGLAEESQGMTLLHENRTNTHTTSICLNDEWLMEIWE